ncbi:MAG: aspartate carbamoyltransferase regulatory subunit [Candidatus Thermoplasmatota archaeon]|nr:aspartate carbamoyltransferase regulatory subunit [Candidatus Thermoplasmatota archaeon]
MKEVRIAPIKNGTVIDHIKPGKALKVLDLLGIDGEERMALSLAMYAHSKKAGSKDLVKIEEKELKVDEVNRLAILTPNASISIIRDFQVVRKFNVAPPEVLEGIVKCENINCITNQNEPVPSRLIMTRKDPRTYKCHYCGRLQSDIEKNII